MPTSSLLRLTYDSTRHCPNTAKKPKALTVQIKAKTQLQNLRHLKEAILSLRCAIEHLFAVAKWCKVVRTRNVTPLNRTSRGRHICRIQLSQLLNVLQNAAELSGELLLFFLSQV